MGKKKDFTRTTARYGDSLSDCPEEVRAGLDVTMKQGGVRAVLESIPNFNYPLL